MRGKVYRFVFGRGVPFDDVIAAIGLSIIAVEGIYGEARSRLDARFAQDAVKRTVALDGSTEVGQALARVFAGYARKEFGETAFRVERADRDRERAAPAGGSARSWKSNRKACRV